VGELVGQDGEIASAAVREEDVVAERHGAATAQPQHHSAGQSGEPGARHAVQPNARAINA
jgi:hypothetical protein